MAYMTKLLTPGHEKTLHLRARFLLVAGTGEISNLVLLKDLAEVVDFIDEHANEFCEITCMNKHVVSIQV